MGPSERPSPNSIQPAATSDLREIWQAETRAAAGSAMDIFADTSAEAYEKAVTCLTKDRAAVLACLTTSQPSTEITSEPPPRSKAFGPALEPVTGMALTATLRHRAVRTKGRDRRPLGSWPTRPQAAAEGWRRLNGANHLPMVIERVKFTDRVAQTDATSRAA